MIKTTLTKLKKAYSTLSFAPRALGVETNGKFYKLILSLMRRADKRTTPDKTEEEEVERGEVLARLMLSPSDTAALFSKGLSKPEAYQKSSFLAPPVDNKARAKSTLTEKDDSKQNDLNNPECDLQQVTESMSKSVPHSMIQPETRVKKAPQYDTETHRQESVFGETKNIDSPNSLQNAIPDIILDKDDFDDCPDTKSTHPKVICSLGKENSNSDVFKNLQSNNPLKVNNMQSKSPHIRNIFNDGDNSPSIKMFSSYDKTRKPPSTETNSTFDELAKHCLDSPNNKIDERLLKEMKKLGVPQTGPSSENSVIEENIIQMDVLRKPRKPAEKTEIDVETTKFEHPPLNYSDEQRLEFGPSTAEEQEYLDVIQKNEKHPSQFCNLRTQMIDGDKYLLNPFDTKNIKFDDDDKDAKNYNPNRAPEAVQLENTIKPLKSFHVKHNTDKPLELYKLLDNKAENEKVSEDNVDNANTLNKLNAVGLKPKSEQDSAKQSKGIADKVTMNSTTIENPNIVNNQPKEELNLPKQSENNADKVTMEKPNAIDFQPKDELDLSKQSENNANNATINSTPLNQSTVNFQPEGELDFSKQSENNAMNVTVNNTPVNQEAVDFKIADEPHVSSKQSEDKVYTAPLINASGINFHTEGELACSNTGALEKSVNKAQKTENREPKSHKLEHIFYDNVPKIPEPLLLFNPPEQRSAKLSIQTNQIELPGANEDLGTDHHIAFVQNLKSLRIRCNVLPTKNTDEKATISLLVEIDALKQPRAEFAERHQPDVTYSEDSADQQKHGDRSIPYLEKIDEITRDKVTMILPEKQEKANETQEDSLPKEKPEIPLSEMLRRVRFRNRAIYFNKLQKNLEDQLDSEVETVTGKCGDKPKGCPPSPPRCPPRCPPPQKSRCPPPATPPSRRPACPRPCKPSCPPSCPPRCPKPCGSSRASGNPCCPGSGKGRKGGNPCCPGSGSGRKGGNPCCPGSGSGRSGGNPCCPGSGSGRKGGNPCCGGCSSTPSSKGPCKFSTHFPTIMMNNIVSLIHQRVTIAESELARNQFFTVTKDAYQRFLSSACFVESNRPRPIFNMCGFDSKANYESMNSMLARDYEPWVPIPCWPLPKKVAKRPYPCPKGCPIQLPGKHRPQCDQYPCRGFPKRKNSFSVVDLYAWWCTTNVKQ